MNDEKNHLLPYLCEKGPDTAEKTEIEVRLSSHCLFFVVVEKHFFPPYYIHNNFNDCWRNCTVLHKKQLLWYGYS